VHVAAMRAELRIRDARSLKDKRRVLKSLMSEVGRAHPIAIAEVDHQDLWNRATVGVAAIASTPGHVERMLRAAERDIDGWEGVEVLTTAISFLETADW
jgi:uncharacterized protein